MRNLQEIPPQDCYFSRNSINFIKIHLMFCTFFRYRLHLDEGILEKVGKIY